MPAIYFVSDDEKHASPDYCNQCHELKSYYQLSVYHNLKIIKITEEELLILKLKCFDMWLDEYDTDNQVYNYFTRDAELLVEILINMRKTGNQ